MDPALPMMPQVETAIKNTDETIRQLKAKQQEAEELQRRIHRLLEEKKTLDANKNTADRAKGQADKALDMHTQQLHQLMEQMTTIKESTKSIPEFFHYDLEFHTAIIHYPDNQQFISLFDRFLYRMQRLASLSLSHPGRMEDTCREHLDILHAMENGDIRNIYEITLRHMEVPRQINLEDIAF